MPKRTERAPAADADTANRRRRLRAWIDRHFSGKQSGFIRAVAEANKGKTINQGELSALLRDKPFGGVKARNIEAQAGMPDRYLDQQDESVPALGPVRVLFGARDDAQEPEFRDFNERVVSETDWGLLQAAKFILTDEEKETMQRQFDELERRAKAAYEQKMAEASATPVKPKPGRR